MIDIIKGLTLSKIIIPVLTVLGGALAARLWIGYKFRKEVSRLQTDLYLIQEAYEGLCWNTIKNEHHQKAKLHIPVLGQLDWDEIQLPLKMCKWFFNSSDRRAIRYFLKMEDFFKEQPNYLELTEGEAIIEFKKYTMRHIWCLNFIKNIGYLSTNKTTIKNQKTYYESLPILFNLDLNKKSAYNKYALKHNIKIIKIDENSNLVNSLTNDRIKFKKSSEI